MANTFCGFDIDRIESLRKGLAEAGQTAGRMSSAVSSLVSQAAALQASGPSLRAMRMDGPLSSSGDPDRKGLSSLAAGAPGMAAEIGRRRAHLIACQQLDVDGFHLDPDVVFVDEPPPDEARVKDALDQFRHSLNVGWGIDGNHDDLQRIAEKLAGLNAAETDALIKQATDDELRKWNDAITKGDGLLSTNGLDDAERMRMASLLNARLGRDSLQRLADVMPSLEPAFNVSDSGDVTFAPISGELLTDGVSPLDVHQGGVGDCWFFAGLESVANKDPHFIEDHIRQNDNGTYTVTLFQDGKPVEVTVDNRFPSRGDSLAGGHGASDWSSHQDLWVAIYEKAFAALKGNYGDTEGGFGSESMPVITGQDTGKMSAGMLNFTMLQAMQDKGAIFTVGTGNDKTLGLWGDGDDRIDDGKLVSQHEYTVKGFDNSSDPPKIILWNPWGTGASADQEVRLTEDEFHDYLTEVSVGRVSGG